MTKQECAIIMAHTGVCMLCGDNFKYFHEYVEKIMGRPVYTHELGMPKVSEEIRQKSLADFLELCANAKE